MNDYSHAALILVGHGSTLNPDSSAPTHLHADTIRQRGIFREVVCCFWKEEPSMREVFESVDSDVIYIVPNFISEGYFCQQVLPRELRLDGPVTKRDGRTIYYCDPVGIHPNMTRLLLQRADEVAPGVPREETSLIIVGHGTNLNDNSTKAIQDQVQLIRQGYDFAEVMDAYMEEAPLVSDWYQMTKAPNVVVVPFFIADGLHSFQDIPVLLGMEEEPGQALSQMDVFRHNPIPLHGRNLYYSSAIGTEPLMADVILDQVHDFDARHGIAHTAASAPEDSLKAALEQWLRAGRNIIGQVHISTAETGYELRHLGDAEVRENGLKLYTEPAGAREIARYDAQGQFRPIKTAPTLIQGWLLKVRDVAELLLALEFFYPAAVGMLLAQEEGKLKPVPLRHLLGRQTGMYRFANGITDAQACEMVGNFCQTATGCLRRITWTLDDTQPMTGLAAAKLGPEAGQVPGVAPEKCMSLLCMEACNHIVSLARKKSRENNEAKSQTVVSA
ncbi:CbiX/SirB N-terminal domain-containing protein [Prosthecobacter debontii]|uniref:CbiX/SirB N-terminal domain-containing protein n=1 Tax=Prosthecobacter debontii TaxID=48467 RepID=UPI00099A4684|nr:CbiX/SirB N-terminal domain-containing protein [Prosthecobacter debontii]